MRHNKESDLFNINSKVSTKQIQPTQKAARLISGVRLSKERSIKLWMITNS
jgi:hypothetical protein